MRNDGRCPFGHYTSFGEQKVCDYCGGDCGSCPCQLERHVAYVHMVHGQLAIAPRQSTHAERVRL